MTVGITGCFISNGKGEYNFLAHPIDSVIQ